MHAQARRGVRQGESIALPYISETSARRLIESLEPIDVHCARRMCTRLEVQKNCAKALDGVAVSSRDLSFMGGYSDADGAFLTSTAALDLLDDAARVWFAMASVINTQRTDGFLLDAMDSLWRFRHNTESEPTCDQRSELYAEGLRLLLFCCSDCAAICDALDRNSISRAFVDRTSPQGSIVGRKKASKRSVA